MKIRFRTVASRNYIIERKPRGIYLRTTRYDDIFELDFEPQYESAARKLLNTVGGIETN